MSYDGMASLLAPGEKFKNGSFYMSEPRTREQEDGYPSDPAYLLLVRNTVSIDDGWGNESGSSIQSVWDVYWSYDRAPWESAVLKIEASNRDPSRHNKVTNYLAFQVESVAKIEMTIRMAQ